MKATIELPDDLYARITEKSAAQGRPLQTVAAELFQRWLDESSDSPTEPTAEVHPGSIEDLLRLAKEFAQHAPPGRTATDLGWQDRGSLGDWLRLGEEASRNAPPGPTATEILDADRNRLERQ
jgi:hypothetical protein